MNDKILEKWQEIKTLTEVLEPDINKAAKGNKAAGLRYRKQYKSFCLKLKELKALTLSIGKE